METCVLGTSIRQRPRAASGPAAAVVCAAAVCVLSAGARGQCPVAFGAPVDYAASPVPTAIAVADFNGDQLPDLVTADDGIPPAISVLMGNFNGTFQAPVNYFPGVNPVSVGVGDFNGDRRPDVAVVNLSDGNIAILLCNGNGTLSSNGTIMVWPNPRWVAVGDLNADGRLDLAVVFGGSAGSVAVLVGNGDGTFQAPVVYPAGTTPECIAIGDFNSDARPDLAVANNGSANVSILLAGADGTFQAAVNYPVGAGPRGIAAGDFNADGRSDLAVTNGGSSNVSILLSNANGTFQPAVNYATGTSPQLIAVGDLNSDGKPDLAVANDTSQNVSILLGNADGTFQPAASYGPGGRRVSIAAGDFNRDGKPDLAVGGFFTSSVSILLNTSAGTFGAPSIGTQPRANQVVYTGMDATLVVSANGHGQPLTYRWRRNGTPLTNGGNIFGADTPSLRINPAGVSDTASYDVRISAPGCGGGTVVTMSLPGVVTVFDSCAGQQPGITQQPAGQSVVSGSAATFTVAAGAPPGGGALAYQWRRNGVNLSNGGAVSGATTPTLTINPAALGDNGAAFDAVVTNACGSARSDPAGLVVAPRCAADFNRDSVLNSQDFFDFLTAFFAGCA